MKNSSKFYKFQKRLIQALTTDENLIIGYQQSSIVLLISFIHRSTLFLGIQQVYDETYAVYQINFYWDFSQDDKLNFLAKLLNWSTGEQALAVIGTGTVELTTMYLFYFIHLSCFICSLVLAFLETYLIKQIILSLERILYYYFTFFPLLQIPTILYACKQLTCQRQRELGSDTKYCEDLSQMINAIILLTVQLWHTLIYLYLNRNISIPVQNYLKRRHNILIYILMLLDFPIILMRQMIGQQILTIVNVLKLIQCILYFIEGFLFRPYHSRLNIFQLQFSSIFFFWSIIFLVQQYQPMSDDNILYMLLVISPLIGCNAKSLHQFLRGEDVLTYIDNIHESIQTQSQSKEQFFKWCYLVLEHEVKCHNLACLSHKRKALSHKKKNLKDSKELTHAIVQCILQEILILEEAKPIKIRNSMEEINLNFINYLMNECLQPLKAYIQLKSFQLKTSLPSFFFLAIKEHLNDKLNYKICQQQILKYQYLDRELDIQKISLREIMETEQFQEKMLVRAIRVVDSKTKLWQHMIQGFARIEDMQEEIMSVTQTIWEVKDLLFSTFRIDPLNIHKSLVGLNGMQLRIMSLVYSTVLNDFYGTLDIEHRLEEIQTFEQNLPQDTILNTTLMENKVLVIQIGVLASRGQILNTNRNILARFFGFESLFEFNTIESIQQLMPKFLAIQHNDLIENYIQKGFSKFFSMGKEVFFLDKQGFLNCSQLRLGNLFENVNDYIITGALLRTKLSQNFIIFAPNGRILGISKGIFQVLNEDNKSNQITLREILDSHFLFLLFQNLLNDLKDDRDEFLKVETNHFGSQKSFVLHNLNSLRSTSQTFQTYLELNQTLKGKQFDAQKTHKSQVNSQIVSKYSGQQSEGRSTWKEKIEFESNASNDASLNIIDDETILDHKIPLLNTQIRQQIDSFLQNQNQKTLNKTVLYKFYQRLQLDETSIQILVNYNIQFQIYGDQQTANPIFICHISEMKKIRSYKNKAQVCGSSQRFSSKQDVSDLSESNLNDNSVHLEPQSFLLNDSVFNQHAQDRYLEKDQYLRIQNPVVIQRSFTNEINNVHEQDKWQQKKEASQDIEIENQNEDLFQQQQDKQKKIMLSLIVSPRSQSQQDLNPLQNDFDNNNLDFEGDKDLDRNKDSQNQNEYNEQKRDIAQVLQENNKKLQQQDNSLKQSSSGATDKTYNSIFILLKTLQYRKKLSKSLAQVILFNSLICMTLIMMVTIQLILISDNLSQLHLLIEQVKLPSTFNELYSHFVGYGQIEIVRAYKYLDQEPYFIERYQSLCTQSRIQFATLLQTMRQEFVQFQEKRSNLRQLQIYRMTENKMLLMDIDFLLYASYFNQDTNVLSNFVTGDDKKVKILTLVTLYNLKWNLPTQIKVMGELVDSIAEEFQQTLDVNSNLYLIILLVELSLVILFVPLQIALWKEHLLYQQKIFLIISRAQQKDAENQIQKYRLFLQQITLDIGKQEIFQQMKVLDGDKQTFTNIFIFKHRHLEPQKTPKSKENRSTLTSRIQESRFSYFKIYTGIIIIVILLCSFLMGAYFFQKGTLTASQPQLTLAMNFIMFKCKYDNLNLLALILKTEQLFFTGVNDNGLIVKNLDRKALVPVFRQGVVDEFIAIYETYYSDFQKIFAQIVGSQKISGSDKAILLALYQNDLCTFMEKELPFCSFDPVTQKFEYFPDLPAPISDLHNYRDHLRYGMSGLTSLLGKTLSSSYTFEIQNKTVQTNMTILYDYLQSKDWNSIVKNYFTDLSKPFVLFENTITLAATHMLDSDFEIIAMFYCLICAVIVSGTMLYVIWRVKLSQIEVRSAQQSLVNLPFEMLLEPQVVSQLKQLEQE